MTFVNYFQILNTLRHNVWLNNKELTMIQERKLNKLLDHSYQNVQFYRRLFDSVGLKPEDIKTIEDLSKIPITTKSQFKNAREEITAKNINLLNCDKLITSGSTGNPLTLYFSKEDSSITAMGYDVVRLENGFKLFRDVLLSTRGNDNSNDKKQWFQHLGIAKKEKFNVFESVDNQIQILRKVRPDVIWGYPSAIKLLAKEIQEKSIKDIFPRLIFTASEVLDPETRKFINSVFNVELFDVYGSHETGCMAWECEKHSGYHIKMDTVLMEFVDDDGNSVNAGERGKVVVTNLHSYAMPIIRYEIGDFAIPTYEECSCGRGGFLIKTIDGRSKDVLVTRKGKIIVSSFIPYLFYPDCTYSEDAEQYKKIKQFQVVQKTKDEILIKIVKEPKSEERKFDYIKTNFKNVFGENADISLIFVESIPKLPSGKNTYIISNLKS